MHSRQYILTGLVEYYIAPLSFDDIFKVLILLSNIESRDAARSENLMQKVEIISTLAFDISRCCMIQTLFRFQFIFEI
jgi:hypothetical protein